MVEKITEKTVNSLIGDLDALAINLEKDCKEAAKLILEAVIDNLNKEIRSDKATRKELGLVLKEKDRIRRVHTKLGVVEFSRDYFYDKTQGNHHNLLDSLLGVTAYERVGRSVSAELVNFAAEYLRGLLKDGLEDDKDTVRYFITYLKNHWEPIRNLKVLDVPEIKESYKEYAERMLEKNIKEKLDWSMFDREAKIFDTGSATQIMLRNLGTNHGITWS